MSGMSVSGTGYIAPRGPGGDPPDAFIGSMIPTEPSPIQDALNWGDGMWYGDNPIGNPPYSGVAVPPPGYEPACGHGRGRGRGPKQFDTRFPSAEEFMMGRKPPVVAPAPDCRPPTAAFLRAWR